MTPLMLTALDGLLNNTALNVQTDVISEWVAFRSNSSLSELREKLTEVYELPEVHNSTAVDLQSASDELNAIRVLSDFHGAFAGGYVAFSTNFADWLLAQVGSGYGNNRRFIATLQHMFAYVEETNKSLNSATNSTDVAKHSFTHIDDLITGNISLVSAEPYKFGLDLQNTGDIIDFSNLANYGTPDALIRVMIKTGAIVIIEEELDALGISVSDLTASVSNNSTPMLPSIQHIIYNQIFTVITGSKLTEIKEIMNVTTSGLTKLSDFLSTRKLFPLSYDTLKTKVNGSVLAMSSNSTATVTVSTGVAQTITSTESFTFPSNIDYDMYSTFGYGQFKPVDAPGDHVTVGYSPANSNQFPVHVDQPRKQFSVEIPPGIIFAVLTSQARSWSATGSGILPAYSSGEFANADDIQQFAGVTNGWLYVGDPTKQWNYYQDPLEDLIPTVPGKPTYGVFSTSKSSYYNSNTFYHAVLQITYKVGFTQKAMDDYNNWVSSGKTPPSKNSSSSVTTTVTIPAPPPVTRQIPVADGIVTEADENRAFAVALQQIKNISKSTPAKLAEQALTIETNTGLTQIESLSTPIDSSIVSSIKDNIGNGSGPDGTYYLTDAFGLLCDTSTDVTYNGMTLPVKPSDLFQYLSTKTFNFTGLISAIDDLIAVDGLFAGTELAGFISACQGVQSQYSSILPLLNSYVDTINNRIDAEKAIFVKSDINLYREIVSEQGLNGFVSGIHSIADKTSKGNIVEVLEKLAVHNKSGEALISSLREGRNLKKLSKANIMTDVQSNDQPKTSEPGDLLQSTP